MADRIHYNGQDKWKSKATDVINDLATQAGGNVADVMVDGVSVVDANKVAQIDLTSYAKTSDLATVATSGDYDDLQNKPTIPAAQVQSDWLEADTTKKSYILNKPTIPSTAADVGAIPTTEKGANSGVAELDSNGKVPSSQLPSYVDDVLEVADYASLPSTGETGKIYVTLDDNKTYRWSGSAYVEISPSLALGETSSTAYRGDRGKTAYDHATEQKAGTTASGLYKIGVTAEGHVASATAVQKSDITDLGIPSEDTNTTYTLGTSGNNVTLTPSSGSVQSVTAPYATNAGKVNNHTVGMDIPTPTAGDETKYLGGDGTFQEVSPKREASGSVVSFSDGSSYPLSKCVVDIEPQQDLHGYDHPWVGGAGKNKCPKNAGTITVGDFVVFDTPLPSGTYSVSFKASRTPNSDSYMSLVVYDKDGTRYSDIVGAASSLIDGVTTIKKENATYNNGISKIYAYSIAGNWGDSRNYTLSISDFQLEVGSSATSFEPYSNICPISGWTEANVTVKDDATSPTTTNTYTISFSSAGTVYGGTLDVLTGELVVDRVSIKGEWIQYASSNGYIAYQKGVPNPKGSNLLCNPISNMISKYGSFSSANMDKNIIQLYHISGESSVMAYMALQEDASDDDVELVYELATPQTYTLTATQIATLLGNNTIYADTGDISVEYVKEPFEGIYDNDKVRQTNTTTNSDYRVLLSGSADDTEHTEAVKKSTYLKFNPSKGSLSVGGSSASGNYSFAEGGGTTASGTNAHSEGGGTTASGGNSHAEGGGSTASGNTSHAEGGSTRALGDYSHAEGFNTTTSLSGSYAHAEGNGTTASGLYAHVEGGGSTASGSSSHAEGASTTASGASAHSEGAGTTASGNYSHAEGYNGTQAVAPSAHAEGTHTTAAGDAAHSEGADTTATGNYAHAEGLSTAAVGYNSHSQGQNTTATHRSQFVFGEYNELDTSTAQASSKGTYVELVGNGTSNSARSNARTLDWSGNETLAGKLTVGANPTNAMDVATKDYVDGLIAALRQQLGL